MLVAIPADTVSLFWVQLTSPPPFEVIDQLPHNVGGLEPGQLW